MLCLVTMTEVIHIRLLLIQWSSMRRDVSFRDRDMNKLYALFSKSIQVAFEESHMIDQIWLTVAFFKIEILLVQEVLTGRK